MTNLGDDLSPTVDEVLNNIRKRAAKRVANGELPPTFTKAASENFRQVVLRNRLSQSTHPDPILNERLAAAERDRLLIVEMRAQIAALETAVKTLEGKLAGSGIGSPPTDERPPAPGNQASVPRKWSWR